MFVSERNDRVATKICKQLIDEARQIHRLAIPKWLESQSKATFILEASAV